MELALFAKFNRVQAIFGKDPAISETNSTELASMLKTAVGKSRMLKLSKDGLKVRRRIPFDAKVVDRKEVDEATIYVENFPQHLTHKEMAKLFARAGTIRNVVMPKFKDN